MTAKSQHNNILLAVIGFVAVIIIVATIGYFTIGREDDIIQGEMEVSEYRVSCKLPGRVAKLKVKEGDYVQAGDTLVILEAPEVAAQEKAAAATQGAAAAMSEMADNGARTEQIQGAYQLYQQAIVARDIAKKSYDRVQNLFNQGVLSAQKCDEALAAYEAREAQVNAAKSQYDMAKNGARREERTAAAKQALAARNAADVVRSLLKETVQLATAAGEVSEIYPKVGELVGTGSPIMNISVMSDMWGTFNVREDQLKGLKIGDTFTAYLPAFDKEIKMIVYFIKNQGSYAVWKATKDNGQYDLKTFEVRARPVNKVDGLRPGMSLVMKK
ncbi:MAG: efflux RND transporter periplasmic adaptor subunit [Prevotella sp.]|nr:efflux RND transporter periplasmic adaptor subunit [Prevotella sp.]